MDLTSWMIGGMPVAAQASKVDAGVPLPMFRDAYRRRRCILPVDAFYEWKATKGRKQPYAIAMKNRSPFGIAGIWENWKNPDGEWVRTFAVLTTPANELIDMNTTVCPRPSPRGTTIVGSAGSLTRATC